MSVILAYVLERKIFIVFFLYYSINTVSKVVALENTICYMKKIKLTHGSSLYQCSFSTFGCHSSFQ